MTKICRCGGATIDRKITIERNIAGHHVVFKNVPVSVCSNCNEQFLAARILKKMDRLHEKNKEDLEIDFESDPKEQSLKNAYEIMLKKSIFSYTQTSDKPLSLSDLFLVTNRLDELRREHSNMH